MARGKKKVPVMGGREGEEKDREVEVWRS